MLFNSFTFFVFVVIVFFLYYLPFLRAYQVPILLLSSFVFYAWSQPWLLLLLIFSALLNSSFSYFITYSVSKHPRILAALGVALNLCILSLFKYASLFYSTLVQSPTSIGEWMLHLPLPVGISFYTFQGISLLVDVYTGRHLDPKKIVSRNFLEHIIKSSFFVVFFPQLVAGPIVKAHDFLYQIRSKYLSEIPVEQCFRELTLGYFLKMVIADNLHPITSQLTYPWFQAYSGITLIVMLLAYSIQIFSDFAGYSLIAIGLARLFGYKLKDNFRFPYTSTSFRDFWTRWHISLSSFLKEYLYIPLGGNRKGALRTYFNLFITMLLGGLWHGASWNYAIWGGVHGLLLALERPFLSGLKGKKLSGILAPLKAIFVFAAVSFAWLFFIFPKTEHVLLYLQTVVKNFPLRDDPKIILFTMVLSAPIVLYHLRHHLSTRYAALIRKWDFVSYGLMLFLLLLSSGDSERFIYFQF